MRAAAHPHLRGILYDAEERQVVLQDDKAPARQQLGVGCVVLHACLRAAAPSALHDVCMGAHAGQRGGVGAGQHLEAVVEEDCGVWRRELSIRVTRDCGPEVEPQRALRSADLEGRLHAASRHTGTRVGVLAIRCHCQLARQHKDCVAYAGQT